MKKVFLSGSFDPLHSGHVALFKKASEYGELYVGIGTDDSVTQYKHTVFQSQEERLYMIKAIRYVKDANNNVGWGFYDFLNNPFFISCDILVVAEDREPEISAELCRTLNKEYISLGRIHAEGLPQRTSTEFRYDSNNY